MDNPTGQQAELAGLEDFCFQDAFSDNIFPDGGLLDRLPGGGLTDEELRAQIKAMVDKLSGQTLAHLWNDLVALKPASSPKPIPTEPPGGQLYENRPDNKQSAPEFIAVVYKEFLNGTFTRADLRRLDPKAATALYNWERINGRSSINLPTKGERTDSLISDVESGRSDDLLRALNAARVRKFRQKTK